MFNEFVKDGRRQKTAEQGTEGLCFLCLFNTDGRTGKAKAGTTEQIRYKNIGF